ncbi:Alanine racemase [Pediococcus damnosus]|uniref:alanine racemase n=1 Tax=Pediococcus damnosus TaxID=51663 RepID=UPI00078D3B44|nr:alanine racemase [Pediococcus damnosus]AMV60176.1 Alanine racemase [Pediococcus damnosus]AMV64420.1 Alanine racemase [Pediococcus damnosus]
MNAGTHRPTIIEVDAQAIRENIHQELARMDRKSDLFAVVKADGYGHGLVQVAKFVSEAGATGFCVAILDEALELRTAGFTQPILILGIVEPKYAQLLAEQKISVAVGSCDWLKKAAPFVHGDEPVRVHLTLDTGMGRIGFQDQDELKTALDYLQTHSDQFLFEGIFTHFATADETDDQYFKLQLSRFNAFMDVLPQRPRYVHVANSATSLWHKVCEGNMIRFGIALYGMNPSGKALSTPYKLKPAMAVTSELVFTKLLKKGRSVGYGATYTAQQDEWIGTLPIGYADGYPRCLQGFHVLVDGQSCEIVGRICMDQLMIRLPHDYTVGTKVVLVGKSGEQEIKMEDVAEAAHTISYEIACGFAPRIPRIYLHEEKS